MTIPRLFTRTRVCEKCLANRIPYENSEDLKRHKLRFIVKQNSSGDANLFHLRKQTKVGVMGFTPHLFYIEDSTIGAHGNKVFQIATVCCVENCGIIISEERNDYLEYSINFDRTLFLNWEDLVHLYNFKDPRYMLDTKEHQIYIAPSIITSITEN